MESLCIVKVTWLAVTAVIPIVSATSRLSRGRRFGFGRSETHQFRVRYVDARSG